MQCAQLVSKKVLEEEIFVARNFCELVFDCENFGLTKISRYTVNLKSLLQSNHITGSCHMPHYTTPNGLKNDNRELGVLDIFSVTAEKVKSGDII